MAGHTYSNILLHIIFSTKERRPTIQTAFRDRLFEYLGGIAREEFGRALRVGGTENHVHGLIVLRPSISVSDAMMKWKSLSSGWLHETFPGAGEFGWQNGYGAFSVSESNAKRVIQYIDGQAAHHKEVSFEDEFIRFLERHGIQYDPRYVWD